MDVFQFGRDAVAAISRAVRWQQRKPDTGAVPLKAESNTPQLRSGIVMLTSTTPTGGLYPGKQMARAQPATLTGDTMPRWVSTDANAPPGVVARGSATGNYQPIGSGAQDCWVEFNAGATVTLTDPYHGIFAGLNPTDGLAIFTVTSASGAGGGSSMNVASTNPGTGDPTITVAAPTLLQFDEASGCTVSNPGAGVAQVTLQAATTTHAGVVETSSYGVQTFGGHKTFADPVVMSNTLACNGAVTCTSTAEVQGNLYADHDIYWGYPGAGPYPYYVKCGATDFDSTYLTWTDATFYSGGITVNSSGAVIGMSAGVAHGTGVTATTLTVDNQIQGVIFGAAGQYPYLLLYDGTNFAEGVSGTDVMGNVYHRGLATFLGPGGGGGGAVNVGKGEFKYTDLTTIPQTTTVITMGARSALRAIWVWTDIAFNTTSSMSAQIIDDNGTVYGSVSLTSSTTVPSAIYIEATGNAGMFRFGVGTPSFLQVHITAGTIGTPTQGHLTIMCEYASFI